MISKLISIILDYSVHSIEIHSNPSAEPVGLSMPHEGFERGWSADWQRRYNAVLQITDLVRFIWGPSRIMRKIVCWLRLNEVSRQ